MKNNNLLDYKPVLSSNAIVKFSSEKEAVIEIEHSGFYSFICSKFFKRPEKTRITLDDMGSYIFLFMDGRTTVYEISKALKDKFKEKAEPLYPRLVKYLELLINKKAIVLRKR